MKGGFMANFVLTINNRQVPIEHLPHGQFRDAAFKFAAPIAQKLQSLHCTTHYHEPLFLLDTKGKGIVLKGLGTCCKEFGKIVREKADLSDNLSSASVTMAKFDVI
jgi:hypothetical protein